MPLSALLPTGNAGSWAFDTVFLAQAKGEEFQLQSPRASLEMPQGDGGNASFAFIAGSNLREVRNARHDAG